MKNLLVPWFALSVAAMVSLTSTASGIVIYNFATPSNASSAGYTVSSTASFSVLDDKIVLTLTNTTPFTRSSDQVLTGVRFSLSTGYTNVDLTNVTGIERSVVANGDFTDVGPKDVTGTWDDVAGANKYLKIAFNFKGPLDQAAAEHGIIGRPENDGNYSEANGSIQKSSGHNPFLAGNGVFTINGASINPDTLVSDVTFYYNTGLGVSFSAGPPTFDPPPIPEPTTAFFGLVLLGVTAVGSRRSGRAARRQVQSR